MFLNLASLMFVLGPQLLQRCFSSTQEAARFPTSPTSFKEFNNIYLGEVATPHVPHTWSFSGDFSGSVPFLLCHPLLFKLPFMWGPQGSFVFCQLGLYAEMGT